MNHHRLSMRKAHGEMDTFLFGFGEMMMFENLLKKTDVLLKFRHTQYAPFGECNALKNNAIFKNKKMACSAQLLQHDLQARWLLHVAALQITLRRRLRCH